MEIPLVEGRGFTQQDSEKAPQVSVVNQALVKKFFRNENPIGKRFSMDDSAIRIGLGWRLWVWSGTRVMRT
jgi:hypothetical protein